MSAREPPLYTLFLRLLVSALLPTLVALPIHLLPFAALRQAVPSLCPTAATTDVAVVRFAPTAAPRPVPPAPPPSDPSAPNTSTASLFLVGLFAIFMVVSALVGAAFVLLAKIYLITVSAGAVLVAGSLHVRQLRVWPVWAMAGAAAGALSPVLWRWTLGCPNIQHIAYPLTGLCCGLLLYRRMRRLLHDQRTA